MKNLVLTLLILVTGIFIFQCADSDDDDEPEYNQADDDDDNILDDIEVNWETCSLFEGQDDGRAECAFVEMPFDWIQLDERTFTVAAKRLLSKSEKSDGQMWLLQGGPGASGTIELTWAMEIFQELYPELDFYTLDARGTGYSEFAECPEQQAESSSNGIAIDITEVDDCIAYLDGTYGDELAVFNPTNAAHDLAALIYHTRTEDGKVLVWGGSGGTFWGQRYLQLFPNQIDGIVLEAIVPAVFSLVFQDEFSEKVADSLFKLCIGDSFCSARIVDPFVFLRDLYV